MFKKFLSKAPCEHNFKLHNIYINDDKDLTNYNFTCENCEEEMILTNYEILEYFKEVFLESLSNQLNTDFLRLDLNVFHISVWSLFCKKYSIDTSFKNYFTNNLFELNVKDFTEITEDNILNLEVIAYGDIIDYSIDGDKIIENSSFLIYKKFNGKYSHIDRNIVNFTIDKYASSLRQEYKEKGIPKRMVEINKEAIKETCKELCIQYKEKQK